jgi:hypothetical protein
MAVTVPALQKGVWVRSSQDMTLFSTNSHLNFFMTAHMLGITNPQHAKGMTEAWCTDVNTQGSNMHHYCFTMKIITVTYAAPTNLIGFASPSHIPCRSLTLPQSHQ